MKEIKDAGVVLLTTTKGEPVMITQKGPDGKDNQVQASMTTGEFLYDRITNPKFTEGMQGLDAVLFAADAKKELDEQRELAPQRGFWLVEDDRGRRYRDATLNPHGGYNPAIQHNLVPIVLPIRDMKDHKLSG